MTLHQFLITFWEKQPSYFLAIIYHKRVYYKSHILKKKTFKSSCNINIHNEKAWLFVREQKHTHLIYLETCMINRLIRESRSKQQTKRKLWSELFTSLFNPNALSPPFLLPLCAIQVLYLQCFIVQDRPLMH